MKEKVIFLNNKGFRLVANIIGLHKEIIQPIVIFAHGLNSSKENPENSSIAKELAERGFCCFLPDFTGHGESEGEISHATVEQFVQDIDASLNYIDKRKEIDPMRIGIYGSSIGGTAALIKATTDGRISALALHSSLAEEYNKYAHEIIIPVLIFKDSDSDPINKERHTIVQWFVEKLSSENPILEIYKDRRDAGFLLSSNLKEYKDREGVVVLALPRGGVVTGNEVASCLHCPLDIIIIKKLGFPGEPELSIGAVSETDVVVLNESIITAYNVTDKYIKEEISRQKAEIEKRVGLYRKGQRIPDLNEKIVIPVDDGVATGATMKAAISTLKAEDISKLILALPVAPPVTAEELRQIVDELVCLETPSDFIAVGSYYQDFNQVTDKEVLEILREKM